MLEENDEDTKITKLHKKASIIQYWSFNYLLKVRKRVAFNKKDIKIKEKVK